MWGETGKMAYSFVPEDTTVTAALRRIAEGELSGALARLERGADAGSQIHGLRKHVKKLRGLIRLARPHFKDYRKENAALRDAARGISALRDAEVMLVTLDRLEAAGAEPALIAPVRAGVAERGAASPDQAAALAAFGVEMAALRDRARLWRVKGDGFGALRDGIVRTWDEARDLQHAARRDPSDEAIHEWRKRVKDHWYQSRLLTPIWPGAMTAHVAAADDLGELLGDHHDLAVFRAHLDDLATGEARLALQSHAAARQRDIEARAFALSERLFAGSSRSLTRRWGVWWHVWRDETRTLRTPDGSWSSASG